MAFFQACWCGPALCRPAFGTEISRLLCFFRLGDCHELMMQNVY
ncbi:hypothetical protein B4168_1875 [Anoxybacillus flavithermus]|nr:hypothetical protein B4168_1875 [Anoxybacillus flavithermus]OAO85530.1 hypothetical protein GT23_2433 [Parageobacillus thermoglucosidasius]